MSRPDKRNDGAARCDACRALCCRLTVVLQPGEDIPDHLTTHLDSGLRVMARDETGWCKAMDPHHMNCGIYERRPSTCRRFVMNGPYCRLIREQDAEASLSPGD